MRKAKLLRTARSEHNFPLDPKVCGCCEQVRYEAARAESTLKKEGFASAICQMFRANGSGDGSCADPARALYFLYALGMELERRRDARRKVDIVDSELCTPLA